MTLCRILIYSNEAADCNQNAPEVISLQMNTLGWVQKLHEGIFFYLQVSVGLGAIDFIQELN